MPLNHSCPRDRTFCAAKPSESGGDVFIWQGMRWLSGENNPPNCTTLCTAPTGVCKQDPNYHTGRDFDYWIPLQFDENGKVQQFDEFVDEFTLSLPNLQEEKADAASTDM